MVVSGKVCIHDTPDMISNVDKCLITFISIYQQVAYNDAFRLLVGEPRWCSASNLFVNHNIPTFHALIRKYTFSMQNAIYYSNNSLVIALVNTDYFQTSKIFYRWQHLLYTIYL